MQPNLFDQDRLKDLEKRLWEAADELRANSKLKSSDYSVPVLGLIFLRFAEARFVQAKEMLERAGFTPNRISAVQRAPMATTFDDAEELANGGSKLPHWSETADPDGPEMQALRKGRDENPLIQAARKAAGKGGAA